ncbi:hypothetical protein [Azospirillum doebereinerae]
MEAQSPDFPRALRRAKVEGNENILRSRGHYFHEICLIATGTEHHEY